MRRGEPIADRRVWLRDGALRLEGRTDRDGIVEVPVPADLIEAQLEIEGFPGGRPIRIGVLQPASEVAGVQQRLYNLGFRASLSGRLDRATAAAVRRFQRRHDLEATGEVDGATRERLVAEHGC
jgi:hypothetical protein